MSQNSTIELEKGGTEKISFPVEIHAREFVEAINASDIVIITAAAGSGKTTCIPPLLLREQVWEGIIGVTEPRIIATTSACRFVAGKVGCQVGEEVGYQIRFDDRTTEGTRLTFMTDGLLVRIAQEDPMLSEYSVIMVDEAHERSLNIDFTLGLLKEAQEKRKKAGLKPLKIIVSSATLQAEKFASYFGVKPLEIPGKMFPVKVTNLTEGEYQQYLKYDSRRGEYFDYLEASADKLVQRINQRENDNDFLVFMPGQDEIHEAIKRIKGKLQMSGLEDEFEILPLYGEMSQEEQNKIFEKTKKRKIIIATNIAETSITPLNPVNVIDSGLIKQIEHNPSTGITSLVLTPHAQKGLEQRKGRAGRLAPGTYDGLFTENDYQSRREYQVPEIQRSDLAHIVLTMKQIGIKDVHSFDFIDPPPKEAIDQAIETLKNLGALDEQENITEVGNLMAELPLEPRKARMIVEAEKNNCVRDVGTICSFLSTHSVLTRPRGKESEADSAHQEFKVEGSDFLTLLKIWDKYEANNYSDDWAQNNFLSSKRLREVKNIRYQLFQILKRNGTSVEETLNPEGIAKSVTAGLIENLMQGPFRHSYRRIKGGIDGIYLHPSSVVFSGDKEPPLVVAAEIVTTSKTYARTIQEVRPEWLEEIAPQLIEKEEPGGIYFDEDENRVLQGWTISLKGSYLPIEGSRNATGEEAVEVFAQALAEGEIALPVLEENKQVLAQLRNFWQRARGEV